VLVPASDGQRQIPLGELARVKVATEPATIRNEDGLLTGYVFVDVAGRDISSYVDEASRVVREQVNLPPGYAVLWNGQYEAMARVRAPRVHHPVHAAHSVGASVPEHGVAREDGDRVAGRAVLGRGRCLVPDLLDYNMSIAAWAGLIALLGVDAQTGVFMLLYLDLA
jgi:Cu(I)/Ag(I) efflux system membrane protein CusA/SilA